MTTPITPTSGDQAPQNSFASSMPRVELPKGGGAIRGIGEKFGANPVTGTASFTVPIATSPGRSGFGPQLSLSYDSGSGNGPYGFGWSLSLPRITRKTDKGLPTYRDEVESDVFILSGAEDLVRQLDGDGQLWKDTTTAPGYTIHRYLPRIEGLFARIERWTRDDGDTHWRSFSRDNILTIYGKDPRSRIADPTAPSRVFSWLICETRDDRGNAIVYDYLAENGVGAPLNAVHQRNRGIPDHKRRTTNRYLKHIRYGNRTSLLDPDTGARPPTLTKAQINDADWMFQVTLDYGEHDAAAPTPDDTGEWSHRDDAFSTYRSGFEIRTARLCRRFLMFHHFPGEENIGEDCLVRSTDLKFTHSENGYAFLQSVTHSGYVRQNGGYLNRSLPPVEYEYSQATVHDTVHEVDQASLQHLPIGLDGTDYKLVDLYGEGIPGILTEQAGGWYYQRNISPISTQPVEFAPLECVGAKPNAASSAQFMDLAGDGRLDFVDLEEPVPGFYEHDHRDSWEPFRPFRSRLNRDPRDPNTRFVDLTGDGLADVLITENAATLVWHPSLGEDGFDAAERVQQALDEEEGPRLVFADGTDSIHLADMSGDGLVDLVRIRNSEICYWPNLGYGHFGTKITMDQTSVVGRSSCFDYPDMFDPRRLRLADIDGSGTTDLIYLHQDGVRLYFNQSGNSFGEPTILQTFPRVDNLSAVIPLDLHGNGTACLAWSSPLPDDTGRQMRYLDLMGDTKPHLLTKVVNNLGAETTIDYASSTKFYLQDMVAGTPWVTTLPFPMHVVEKVTMRDKWRDTSFTSTYSYHHGYFDEVEREFRGFGRVDQVDVEDYGSFAAGNTNSPYVTQDHRLYQPPIKTVTWYHTGALLEGERILHQFEREYFPSWFEDLQPGKQVLGTFSERALPDPDLDALSLTADEHREALRACKGVPLHQEVYELDIEALERGRETPVQLVAATTHTSHIRREQPRAGNRHAVFHATESEAISYHYELDLRSPTVTPDPRITHTLNLNIDNYGNVLQAVTVGYPRWQATPLNDPLLTNGTEALVAAVQGELHVAYTETLYTDDVADDPDNYRLRLPCEVQTYELTGVKRTDAGDGHYFSLDSLREFKLSEHYQVDGSAVESIQYHQLPERTKPQKRLIEMTRSLFFDEALDGPLPLGTLNTRALPYETYTLALTESLLSTVFGDKRTPDVTAALNSRVASGYLSGPLLAQHLGQDTGGQYWRCTGIAGYNAHAPQRFFQPERYTDPFGNVTLVDYDSSGLFVRASTDALGNRTEVTAFDFRVMAACQIQDINGNRSEVCFDVLGMPVAMTLSGKNGEGDTLNGLDLKALNPDLATLVAFFVTNDYDSAEAKQLLGSATTRHLYYLGEVIQNGRIQWGKHPPCAAGIVREQHISQQPDSPVQAAFEYSDGGGNVLVKKIQAEPKLPDGPLRWVASGKSVLNNKGKPVKQYEPYFSPPAVGHRFEEPDEIGVTPVLFYDAVGRLSRTDSPDGSFTSVEFSPWHVTSNDANDTVLEPGNAWYARMSTSALAAENRAAQLASSHAGTPGLTLLDSLGRAAVTIAHNRANGTDEKHITFTKFDAEGKPLWVQDARGNRVMQYVAPLLPSGTHPFDDSQNLAPQGFTPCYDISGQLLFQHSMDAGDRWMLPDATGEPLFAWNSRRFRSRMTCDALRRPVCVFVSAAGDTTLAGARRSALPPDPEVIVERRVYGEKHTDTSANLRGKPYCVYDGAGVATCARYDFQGNLVTTELRFARDYKTVPDWSMLADLTDLSQIAAAAEPLLEPAPPLTTKTNYDALNRPTTITTPDNSEYRPSFNDANLLQRVEVNLRGAATATRFVTNIDYNAKGQRIRIHYGNGSTTRYDYDALTFRLTNLHTTRVANPDTTASLLFTNMTVIQDLHYTYDPVGNITRLEDTALKATAQASTTSDYVYDALYRLIAATGREHTGQTGFLPSPNDGSRRDYPFAGARIHPNDLQGLRGYIERYRYDAVGNIVQLVHHSGLNIDQPGQTVWQRHYQYALDSNRILATSMPGDPDNLPNYATVGGYTARYDHDAHGNITRMVHLPLMRCDFKDQLTASAQQVAKEGMPETTYYVYDSTGERARKVTETSGGARKSERLYLGDYEIYREYSSGNVSLERETFHVMDDKQRIAIVETATTPAGAPRIRYQLGNHLGSASVELDQGGALIAYEEYHPYGTTAFQAGRSAAEMGLKRYRYTGKERDEQNGLSYHGARHYVPWLARWASCDPAGLADGFNLYAYAQNSPVIGRDDSGCETFVPLTGVTGPLSEEAAVGLAGSQGWNVRGFRGYNASGVPIFDYGEKMTPRDKDRFDARHLFDFIRPGGAGTDSASAQPQPEIGPAQPIEAGSYQLEYEGHKLSVSEDAFQSAMWLLEGNLKEGVRVSRFETEIDPAAQERAAQEAALPIWKNYKYFYEDLPRARQIAKEVFGPAYSASGAPTKFVLIDPIENEPYNSIWRPFYPLSGGTPMGFTNRYEFESFSSRLYLELNAREIEGEVFLQGSSVTGHGYRSQAPFDYMRTSDYDLAIVSPQLIELAQFWRVPTRGQGTRTGPLSQGNLRVLGLSGFTTTMSKVAGRPVNVMIYSGVRAVQRAPSIRAPR
ncbi:SpvB/TcaC N-terminal domain-containing protein [Rhodococcus koreensis]